VRARQNLEGLSGKAAHDADRYLVEQLAVRLVDLARERYERLHQPDVVKTATPLFSRMTDGRYTRLSVPLGGGSITVVSDSDQVHDVAELSRGTAEQLYLALRVGLISSFGEQAPHLPVLMDDVIVNFDPERRDGAAVAIAELAARRQVIFFTCHPDTAEVLERATGGASTLRLDRCPL
jgi:uncharacterized protein YhaN